jgi:UDP-N-acetylmuramate--alanine ligase
MVGIGGIGMSALAQILLARGVSVSGSDAHMSDMVARLVELGAKVTVGHRGDSVRGASRVVVSDAIQAGNPELEQARSLGIPVRRRSHLMAELMVGYRGIAVAGTHGKTTLTAMIGIILAEAGHDPTVVVGGEYRALGGNTRVGRGEWFVVEACEAYESFLDLSPEMALVSNIEPDHLDHHKTEAHLRGSFARFLKQVKPEGCVVLCADRPELTQMATELEREALWYGTAEKAEVRGTNIRVSGLGAGCRLSIQGEPAGELHIAVPGVHNLVNALGAVAVAWRAGVPLSACHQALSNFTGVARRFQVVGEGSGVTVVDDYAHHPTELAATVSAARAAFPGRRVVAIFQPHLYSRTRDFAEDFAHALSAADLAVLTDIYPAREAPLPGVSSGLIASHLRRMGEEDAVLEMPKEEAATKLPARLKVGDVVLVMGAGDIGEVAGELVRHLGGNPAGRQEVVAKQ